MKRDLDSILAGIADGRVEACYLVSGDRVVSEPAAVRVGEALCQKFGGEPTVHRRPAQLLHLLDDLRTFSLFDPAKVIVAVETAVVGDLSAAAGLVDQAIKVLPVNPAEEPSTRERDAAIRLVQALRLLQIDPYQGAADQAIKKMPDWSFQGEASLKRTGRSRARAKKQIAGLKQQCVDLLEAGRAAGIEGRAEGAAEAIAEILEGGLPEGHVLVLAESSVAAKHPLVAALDKRGSHLALGGVEASRRGWEGLRTLTEELERETGAGIDSRAVEELARRTLRKEAGGRGRSEVVDSDSTARFAAEYRKLAEMAGGERIRMEHVEGGVEDRGEEDVWKILDDIGAGRAGSANRRLRRHMASADDPIGGRLSFFGLLATYCRHLAAIDGALERSGVARGERNFNRFKSGIAPRLQADLANGKKSPLGGLHPFRLHKAYLAACRVPSERIAGLLDRVLEAELRLKGESRSPEATLELLVAEVASPSARA